ncbi:exonuclease SbcCD subunit D [Rhodocaloribacter litoris]|uniref:metallophosphoesterase family protein n=1 Tax=Rhodocaloribacter litoris TaxID=2558931 RepID=UPI001424A589|nr:exonuclease SbcCD subunit D [Rhodocaloribacter litoris]QXD15877.1 exonuclease SbcCD subunit D [Rhodocaloribacter litoris]
MKLLHTADIHLGSNTYGRIDPETGLNTRLLDFKRAFDFMVERALEEDIDLFLFCGDAYRTADPTPTQQRTFAECLQPIAERGIPIAMIVGNHDHPVSFGKASALDIFSFIQGEVHVFRKPDMQTIRTKRGPVQLLALPWPIRSMLLSREEHRKKSPAEIRAFIEAKYLEYLDLMMQDLDPAVPAVLAAHLTVQGAELAGSERTSLIEHEPKFTAAQLARPGLDYVALGHIHRPQDRNEGNTPPVVYCGSIERISFKEWEDRKGFFLVDIETTPEGKRTTYRFVETPARPFVHVQVDARGAADPTEVILTALARHEVADAIVRVRYHIEEDQAALVDVPRIREALKTAHVIASIERTVDPAERQRRTVVTRESSLEEAMTRYIAQHDELAPLKDRLLQAALELEAEYEARRRAET